MNDCPNMKQIKWARRRLVVGLGGLYLMFFLLNTGLRGTTGGPLVVSEEDGAIFLGEQGEIGRYEERQQSPPQGVPEIYAGSGFFSSLKTPQGRELLEVFPAGQWHHRGLFSAWARIRVGDEEVDVWNVHRQTGWTEAVGQAELSENGFVVRRRHMSRSAGLLIEETWRVEAEKGAAFHTIDVDLEQTVRVEGGLTLEAYRYGGFAYRGRAEWNPVDERFLGGLEILTSEGATQRENANHQAARWISVWGPTAEGPIGLVMLQHPDSERYPQKIRIHPRNPYFVFCPMVDAPLHLEEGGVYRARFRILAFDGIPEKAVIEEAYRAYLENHDSSVEAGETSRQ